MKKLYGLFLLTVLLFAAGCKQDAPVVPAYLQNTKLLGKWYLKQLVITPESGPSSSVSSFSNKDFFDFKAGNIATFSSTIYNTSYEGYYSANSLNNPTTLSFKSGTFVLRYDIYGLDPLGNLILDEVITDSDAGFPTTTIYRYIYNKTL